MARKRGTPGTPEDPPTDTPATTPIQLHDLPAPPVGWQPPADAYERRIGARRQGGRRRDDDGIDPAEIETRNAARAKLVQIKQQMQQLTADMLEAPAEKMLEMTQRLQRLRVSMLVHREIVEGVADPGVYREMNLLNKMATGHDAEAEALKKEQEAGEAEARTRLSDRGINPENAAGMVRAFEALTAAMKRPVASAPDDTEPTPSVN